MGAQLLGLTHSAAMGTGLCPYPEGTAELGRPFESGNAPLVLVGWGALTTATHFRHPALPSPCTGMLGGILWCVPYPNPNSHPLPIPIPILILSSHPRPHSNSSPHLNLQSQFPSLTPLQSPSPFQSPIPIPHLPPSLPHGHSSHSDRAPDRTAHQGKFPVFLFYSLCLLPRREPTGTKYSVEILQYFPLSRALSFSGL